MPQFNLKTATADEAYARWQELIARIKNETIHLFTSRAQWRIVAKMFEENTQLNAIGGDVYEWMLLMWGNDALIAVRRELDNQRGNLTIVTLLKEMAQRPKVCTRRRYLDHLTATDSPHLRPLMHKGFDKFGSTEAGSGDSLDDHLDPAVITKDLEDLQNATAKAYEYAQLVVAHRTPTDKLTIQIKDIHDAIDVLEPTVQKYYCIFTGSVLMSAEATVQYDWAEPFDIPWRVKK